MFGAKGMRTQIEQLEKDKAALQARIEKLEGDLAKIGGQVTGVFGISALAVLNLDATSRARLVRTVKKGLGKGMGGDPAWVTEEQKKKYNNSMSEILQRFIVVVEEFEESRAESDRA